MSVYSCYSTDPNDKRIKSETMLMQDGWRVMHRGEIVTREPVMKQYPVKFKRTTCGVEPQAGFVDGNCRGCVHDGSAVMPSNVEVQGRAAALAPRSVPCNDGLGIVLEE